MAPAWPRRCSKFALKRLGLRRPGPDYAHAPRSAAPRDLGPRARKAPSRFSIPPGNGCTLKCIRGVRRKIPCRSMRRAGATRKHATRPGSGRNPDRHRQRNPCRRRRANHRWAVHPLVFAVSGFMESRRSLIVRNCRHRPSAPERDGVCAGSNSRGSLSARSPWA
jgi:hypothetical protein